MVSLKDKINNVKSFNKRIRIHIEKVGKYMQGDPYIADKYRKELSGFQFQAKEILDGLNNHESVQKLILETESLMDELEREIQKNINSNI